MTASRLGSSEARRSSSREPSSPVLIIVVLFLGTARVIFSFVVIPRGNLLLFLRLFVLHAIH